MTRLAFLDTETNSLIRPVPWEVFFVIEGESEAHQYHIQYGADVRYDAQADAVNQRTQRLGKDTPVTHESDAAHVLHDALRDTVFVGSKPSFDQDAISNLLARHYLSPSWSHRYVDIPSLVSGHLHRQVYGLKEAALMMGIDWSDERAHSAQYDALIGKAIYLEVMDR